MAVSVTGAAWTPGMTVDAANVGVQTISSSGTLSCVTAPASDLWPSSAATTYITAGENASLTLLVESQVFTGTVSASAQGTQSVWVRARRTTPASITDGQFGFINNTTLNAKAIGTLFQVKKDTNQPAYGGGIVAYVYNITDSTGLALTECGYCVRGDGVTALQVNKPCIPFDQWVEVSMYRKAGGAATGRAALVINGQITSSTLAYDTGTTAAQQNAFTIVLPALTGVTWDIGAMKTTLTASGSIPALFSDTYRAPANQTRSRRWPVTFSALTTAIESYNWTITRANAADLYAIRPYSVALLNGPQRERIVTKVRSATSAAVHTCTSTRDIGTPDYNAEGWSWFVWEDVLVHANVTYFEINAAGNGSVSQAFYIDTFGKVYPNNTATGTPIATIPSGPTVICVCLAVNSDGRRYFTIIDKTTNFAGTATSRKNIIAKGPLDKWTPAALGKAIFRSGYSTSGYMEFAGFSEHRYLALAACDSFSENRFPAINWGYWTYTGSTGSLPAAGAVITDSASTGFITVRSIDTTNRVVFGAISDDWTAGAGVGTHSGGTLTGMSATLNPVWIGTGTITNAGNAAVGMTFTETTSGATARLLITTALDASTLTPTGMAAFQPLTGTLTGNLTMTGTGGSPPSFTGDIWVIGCQRSNLLNGTSTTVYSCGQDAYAPGFLCPFNNTSQWTPDFVAACGRGGRTMEDAHQGASVQGIPAVFYWIFGGLANSMSSGTTALADANADKYTRAVVAECVSVAENDGYAVWESPTFGTSGTYAYTHARRVFDRAVPATTAGLTGVNKRRRIYVVPDQGFPGSDGGTHYSVAGAALQAARGATSKLNLASAGGGRSGRSSR